MTIILPGRLEVDPKNLPEDFEDQIRKVFTDYTEGTAEAYTFKDKLCFIDLCVEDCHGAGDSDDIVAADLKKRIGRDIEYGDFPEKDDYFSFEGMEYYCRLGKESQRMYSHNYPGDKHDEEVIEKMLIRIMQAVLSWEAK